ncbi:hypothetical protein C7C56_026935 [Massilia glaciei]|uniref:Amino acid ABC transporter substrate-binding protein n=1 Tax=Massilia glaciei TaxID=1524097 RepID=A0A2U2H9Z8_9BURK|nr:hypothetical protein C7C56_026935 [Massilia glaciei]
MEGSAGDVRGEYPEQLLRRALAYSGAKYAARPARMPMQQRRALLELEHGGAIDVVWTMTSREREQKLLPIRIPIDKGLIGWRLLLIRDADLARFESHRDGAALKRLLAVQVRDWPDLAILRANGFQAYGSASYDSTFPMLLSGRVDYFPRSIGEVWREAARFEGEGLSVAPSVVLHYPSAIYFFVHKDNHALARDVERGLEAMLADGAFDRLFKQFHDAELARSALRSRRVVELDNPLLPEQTPLTRKKLWLLD